MIYFIRSGRRVKIGYAADPYKRIRELQTGSSHELELLGFIPGSYETETLMHGYFEPYHIRAEWFRLSQEVKLFIKHRDVSPLVDFLAGRILRSPNAHTELADIFIAYKAAGGHLTATQVGRGLRAICDQTNIRLRREKTGKTYLVNVSLVPIEPKTDVPIQKAA